MTTNTLSDNYQLTDEQIGDFWSQGFIVLKGVLSPSEIEYYGAAIRDTAMAYFRDQGMKPTFGGAFLQQLNLRMDNDTVREFCLSRRFGSIAARLLQRDRVRIYHDQALFKSPGDSDSYWHQDQYFWPLATDRSLGLWMPLVDCDENMGSLRYASGSHRYGNIGQHKLSDKSGDFFDKFIQDKELEVVETGKLEAGDCCFHLGWTIHGAPSNRSDKTREAMIVTFFPDGTKVDELTNESRVNDAEKFLGGRRPGEPADSELNPIVYP